MDTETRTIIAESKINSFQIKKYRIKIIQGPGKGFEKTLERRLIYVGSAPDLDFPIDDPTVSKAHCKIEADKGGYRLKDLNSKNGTIINNVRVTECYLPKEATLKIGNSELLFQQLDGTIDIEYTDANQYGNLIGESMEMREIFALLQKVAPSDITVLIEGESGTGKELVAEAVHYHSTRNGKPFVIFDCSAVPSELIESELFGHIKGAFTGATMDRIGAFEEANGGTLFIDEIGELSMELQPKLLRALEKLEIKPVGSNRRIKIDTRIVAATNRNLEKEVEQGNFRQDLYYRLAVIRIFIPPLRNRPSDIPTLVDHFLKDIAQRTKQPEVQISYDTMAKLQKHNWPGNVRELRNFIERAAILADDGNIETKFIHKKAVQENRLGEAGVQIKPSENTSVGNIVVDYNLPFKDAKNRLVEAFEKAYWTRLLNSNKGNISKAARDAGIHRKSLEYLIKKLDIHPKQNIG